MTAGEPPGHLPASGCPFLHCSPQADAGETPRLETHGGSLSHCQSLPFLAGPLSPRITCPNLSAFAQPVLYSPRPQPAHESAKLAEFFFFFPSMPFFMLLPRMPSISFPLILHRTFSDPSLPWKGGYSSP